MLHLFLTQLATGSILILLLVPPRAAGRGFFRYTVAQSCAILVLGLAVSPPPAASTLPGGLLVAGAGLLMAAAGLFHLRRLNAGLGLMILSLGPLVVGVISEAMSMIPSGDSSLLSRALYPLDALTAGLAPGSALIAMILGHYYLNVPGLAIGHLQRLTLAFATAVVFRLVVVGVSLARHGGELLPLFGLLLDTERAATVSSRLDPFVIVFVILHILFGLLAPGILALMSWRTALIASTQSATGILYVAVVLDLVGELASRYLLVLTGLPL